MHNLKQRKHDKQSKFAQIVIVLFLVSISLGFAYIQSVLKVEGNTTLVSSNKPLNIYFDNISVTEGSVESSAFPQIDRESLTKIYFSAKLVSVTDFYEFEVDIVNGGDNDAKISDISLNGFSGILLKYFDYTITYSDKVKIKSGDLLSAGSAERIKVRLDYNDKASRAPELFGEGLSTELSFSIKFVPNDGTGQVKKKASLLYKLDLLDDVISDKEINFGIASSDTNGNGLYIREGTGANIYPIYYYRGAVTNNNIIFADFCWKIVRTTETGGTKLIYNGAPNSGKCTNTTGVVTQLSSTSRFNESALLADVGLKYSTKYSYNNQDMSSSGALAEPIEEADYNILTNTSSTPYNFDKLTKSWISNNHTDSSTSVIEFSIAKTGNYYLTYKVSSEQNYDKATFYVNGNQKAQYSGIQNGVLTLGELKESDIIKVQYSKDGSQSKNDDNVVFSIGKAIDKEKILYGNNFRYENGEYVLYDTKTITSWENDNTLIKNHYTCFNLDGICSSVFYILITDSSQAYYVTLKDGENLEDVVGNKNKSTILNVLDTWYETNIENDVTNKHYEKYLEDAVWCNDRTLSSVVSSNFYYDAYVTRKLTLSGNSPNPAVSDNIACPNIKDRFTTNLERGNGALKYPIGLITADEATLAGNGYNGYSSSASYLYTGQAYWTMTPYYFSANTSYIYSLNSSGRMILTLTPTSVAGVRPMLSLNSNVDVLEGGDGTANNPYVVDTTK